MNTALFHPSVIETTGRSQRAYDLQTKLLQDRIIYLCGEVNEFSANSVIMQLLWLKADNPEKAISLYINSPGGHVHEGYGIKDIMDTLPCKVNTVGIGSCSSMGAYLLAAGTGSRKATKNCRVMLHSISGGCIGNFHDMKVQHKESEFIQDQMMQDLSNFTNGKMTKDEVEELTKRDHFMSASEAIEKGFLDSIV